MFPAPFPAGPGAAFAGPRPGGTLGALAPPARGSEEAAMSRAAPASADDRSGAAGGATPAAGSPKVGPREMANAIRALSMDAVEKAKSGHPGAPMGMADIATVLFTKFLKYD